MNLTEKEINLVEILLGLNGKLFELRVKRTTDKIGRKTVVSVSNQDRRMDR